MSNQEEQLVLAPLPACDPEIGHWLAAYHDTRRRTLGALGEPSPDELDARPDGENTLGALLYHIADVEISWIYELLLEKPYPPEILDLFPHKDRDEQGILTKLQGHELASYLDRLSRTHAAVTDFYRGLTVEEFRRPYNRQSDTRPVTPEWILHHLMQHEAEHRGHIQVIKEGLERMKRDTQKDLR